MSVMCLDRPQTIPSSPPAGSVDKGSPKKPALAAEKAGAPFPGTGARGGRGCA